MKRQMKSFTPLTKPLVLFVLLFALGVGQMWGWNWPKDATIYFDIQNCTGFGTPYFRIGRDGDNFGGYSYAPEMHLVQGTKYLYYYTQEGASWDNYGAFSVANNYGWQGPNTIYQPYYNNGVYPNENIITKQTNFQKYEVTTNAYLKITNTAGAESNNCQYYQVNNYTNNVGNGELVELPMYPVTFESSPTHGTVSVQKYTKTDGSTKSSLSTADEVYPTHIIEITTTPDTHYALASLTVTGAEHISGTTYYVTDTCEITATFAPRWNIKGSMDEGWSAFHPLDFQSSSAFSGTIELDAHTAYRFKVFDRLNDGRSFGCGTAEHDYTYVGQTEVVPLQAANNHTLMLMTTVGGDYTFNWDSTAKTLQIVYPTTIKHPSMDYVYMEKYSGWNSGKSCNIHYWYTDGSGDHALTSNGEDPKITTRTLVKRQWTGLGYDTAFYTFPVLTDYPKFKAADNASGGTGTNHTSDDGMVTTGHEGHYVYYSDGWKWHTIQVYIELENNGADEGKKGDLGRNVAFNDTSMNTAIICPQKSNYTFGGYYTGDGGTGTQIILDNGKWKKSVADYTTADTAWIHAGDTTKLYAKWTETPRTITLQVSPEGAGSFLVGGVAKAHGDEINAYISTATPTITATPSHAAWKFARWEYGTGVGNKAGTGGDNTVQITSDRDGTLTAVFEPRFCLVGDKYDGSSNGGMPGWASSVYDDSDAFFTVNSTSPSVNLTCTCTLDANTRYRFQVHDRAQVKNLGAGTNNEYALLDGDYVDMTVQDMNVTFTTTGEQRYIFHIYGILENDRPRLEILWPRQVNFGWKYVNADEPNSKKEGGGGTVTAYVHEGGVKTAISTGNYMMQGDSISFKAHPFSDYDCAGWWGDYSYAGERLFNTDSIIWKVTSENANAYAKFTEKTNTLNSGSTWSTATWSKGHVPTLDEVAVIKSPVEVNVTDAKAKKVLLRQDGGNTGKIEIPAGKELVVRTTIKKTTDGSSYGSTGYEDINIGSTLAAGNGALVMNEHDGTNKATVYFATKAKTVEQNGVKHNVNQFIGTPFNDENDILYDYYGTKIYEFRAGQDGTIGNNWWRRLAGTGDKMHGFLGYNILTNQTTEPVLEMTGTLCKAEEHSVNGYYGDASHREYLFANSWVAPIYIPNFEEEDFVNMEKTIYIFNAGTPEDQSGHAMGEGTQTTTAAGQYCVVPVKAAEYTGLKVIPSMQAFSVFANGASPSLKFNYTRLVYNPANGTATIVPNRTPRRTAEEDSDAPTVLRLAATGESGYAAKIVLLERTDFTDNFDDGWDGRFLAGDEAAPQLYAVTPDGNMAINSIPNIEGTLLGFKAGEADDLFTFSFDYDGEALYLYDTQLQTYTRVLTGNTYAFTTTDNTAHNRFILTRNAPGMATGTEPVNNASQVTNKMMIDNHLYIFRGGVLYDATGRMIK